MSNVSVLICIMSLWITRTSNWLLQYVFSAKAGSHQLLFTTLNIANSLPLLSQAAALVAQWSLAMASAKHAPPRPEQQARPLAWAFRMNTSSSMPSPFFFQPPRLLFVHACTVYGWQNCSICSYAQAIHQFTTNGSLVALEIRHVFHLCTGEHRDKEKV